VLILRKSLCWTFAFMSVVCLNFALSPILRARFRHGALPSLHGLLIPALFAFFTAAYAAAWWTLFRRTTWARVCGIAASVLTVMISLRPILLTPESIEGSLGVVLAIGILGLIAFLHRVEMTSSAAKNPVPLPIPGDWTSQFVNKAAQAFIFVVSFLAYRWWISWIKTHGALTGHSSWVRLLGTLLVLLLITTVHELGHAAAGLSCGMKLRAFFVGPFQWRMRDGKWGFHFNPKGILLAEGITGIVPSSGKMPRWLYLAMIAAGPLANVLTGVSALLIASTLPLSSPAQAGGLLALCGAWSLALAAGNLLPFRTASGYSDGATILQLLTGGTLADLHMAIAAIGSSLVSPTRPKDYDILTIQRAACGVAQGRQALLLRLYAFSHCLDRGKNREASEALAQAESVYLQSASEIPADLHTCFVFGTAYVRRDARAAREWWDKMQSKKPANFNADYWRAESALHWIEGDLEKANQAWEKSNALAQQLPKAGAYEFGRHCCSLLRSVLDEAAAAAA
jgi:hypothetical protein